MIVVRMTFLPHSLLVSVLCGACLRERGGWACTSKEEIRSKYRMDALEIPAEQPTAELGD